MNKSTLEFSVSIFYSKCFVSQDLINIFEWLSVVIPGLLVSISVAYIMRRWWRGKFRMVIAAYISGLVVTGLIGAAFSFGVLFILSRLFSKCLEEGLYDTCYNNETLIGPAVVISLIGFGSYLAVGAFYTAYRLALKVQVKFTKRAV